MAQFQYQSFAAPGVVPSVAAPPLSWSPAYPDQAGRGPQPSVPAAQGAHTEALSPAFPLPRPLVWLGRWADIAPGPRPLVNEGFRNDPSVSIYPLPKPLTWQPKFDDFTRSKPGAGTAQFPFYSSGSSVLPLLDPVIWQPKYPDTIDKKTTDPSWVVNPAATPPMQATVVVAGVMQAAIVRAGRVVQYQQRAGSPFTSATTPLTWQSKYDDFARSKQAAGAAQFQFYTRADVQTAIPIIESWLTEFADFARGPAQPTAAPTTFTTPDAQVPLPLTWQPKFDDFARTAPRVPQFPSFAAGSSVIPLADPVVWQTGRWPDWFEYKRAFWEGWRTNVWDTPTQTPLSWGAKYDDFARGPARAADFQSYAAGSSTIPLADPVAWWSRYPDWCEYRRPFPEGFKTQSWDSAAEIEPLSWKGTYPDRYMVAARVPDFEAYASGSSVIPLADPLVWLARYVDRAPGRQPLPDWQTVGFDPFPFTITTDQMGWRGQYADFARTARTPIESWQAYATGTTSSVVPLRNPIAWDSVWPDFILPPGRVPVFQPYAFDVFPRPSTPALSWQPAFADWIARRVPVLEGGAVTVYDPSSALTPLLAWRTVYPSTIDSLRLKEFPAFTTGLTSSSIPLPAPLVWQGRYADRAPGARPLVDWQTLAFNPNPVTLTTDQFAWRGYAPSWLPVQRPVEYPAFATGLTASSIPLPRPLVWLGKWADRAPGRQPLTDWQTLALYPFPTPVATDQLGWRGYQPPWLPLLRPVEFQAFTTGSTQASIPVPRPLVWLPRYDDFALSAKRVADFPAVAFVESSGTFVPVLAWNGVYPEVARGKQPDTHQFYAFVESSGTFVPALAWAGVYPEVARGKTPNTQQFYALVEASGVFVPLLAWGAEYPDFATGLRLPVADMPASVLGYPSGVFVPPVSWLANYPDRAPGQTFLTDLQQALATVNRILVNLPPLSWQGVYADTVDRKVLPTADMPTFAEITPSPFNVPPLSWKAKFDDFARANRLATANMPFEAKEPSKESFVVVTPNSWEPIYADFARGRQPINVGASLFMVRLVVFGPASACFHAEAAYMPWFDLEGWWSPSVRPEMATMLERLIATDENEWQPGVTDESIVMAAFTNESVEVC